MIRSEWTQAGLLRGQYQQTHNKPPLDENGIDIQPIKE